MTDSSKPHRTLAVVRTPDDRFDGLPDFGWRPRYCVVEQLRLARIDEGEGRPVVFLHGEPTWSFLWRNVIPPVLAAGWRCLALDLPGFGRSDKPLDFEWHSYSRHVDLLDELLFVRLDLRGVTLVLHDWGGPIGLDLSVRRKDRVEQIVLMNTGLLTGHQKMSDAWHSFRRSVAAGDLDIGSFVASGVGGPLDPAVVAGYQAPFPDVRYKAGPLALPAMVPLRPDAPGAHAGRAALQALRGDTRRKLLLWGEKDQYLPSSVAPRLASTLRCDGPQLISDAGHFLPEHSGKTVGGIISEWLGSR